MRVKPTMTHSYRGTGLVYHTSPVPLYRTSPSDPSRTSLVSLYQNVTTEDLVFSARYVWAGTGKTVDSFAGRLGRRRF